MKHVIDFYNELLYKYRVHRANQLMKRAHQAIEAARNCNKTNAHVVLCKEMYAMGLIIQAEVAIAAINKMNNGGNHVS